MNKVAMFGGTFDPIHCAHLTIAREAADRFELERVLFVPAANPPHKQFSGTSYDERFRMVELACEADSRFMVSDLEAGREKSYSITTISLLRPLHAELYFLIGSDAFELIRTWHRWEEVVKAVTFIVASRPGYQYEIPAQASVLRLDTTALEVSSSDIRREIAAGVLPKELPAGVARYVEAHQLYGYPRESKIEITP